MLDKVRTPSPTVSLMDGCVVLKINKEDGLGNTSDGMLMYVWRPSCDDALTYFVIATSMGEAVDTMASYLNHESEDEMARVVWPDQFNFSISDVSKPMVTAHH